MDLKLEVEAKKFMSSIIPSKHQETIHLPEGAWHQNAYANNIWQFTSSQQENHSTKTKQNLSALKQMQVHKDKNTTSRRHVFKEEDIHETGTKPPNNLRLQNEIKTTTKRIREDNGRRGNNKENLCSNEMIRPRQLDQPWHLSTNNCNHEHAKCVMERELTAFIKENSLCDCEDCSTREEENKEK